MLYQNDILQKKLNGSNNNNNNNMMIHMNNLSPYMNSGGVPNENSSSNTSSMRNNIHMNFNKVSSDNNKNINEFKKHNNYETSDRSKNNINYYGNIQSFKTNPVNFKNPQLIQNKNDNFQRIITVGDNIELNARKKVDAINIKNSTKNDIDKRNPSISILKKGKSSSVFTTQNIKKNPSSHKVQSYDNYRNVTFNKTNENKAKTFLSKEKSESKNKIETNEISPIEIPIRKSEKKRIQIMSPKSQIAEVKKESIVEDTKKGKVEEKSGISKEKKLLNHGVLKNSGSGGNPIINNKNEKKEKKEVIIIDKVINETNSNNINNNILIVNDKKKKNLNKNDKIIEFTSKRSLPYVILLDIDDDMIDEEKGLTVFEGFISIDKKYMIRKWNGFEWEIINNYLNFFIKAKYDNKGNIWCINDKYEILKLMKTKVKNFHILANEEIIDLAFDKENILWSVNRKGQLLKWNKTNWKKINYTGFHKLKSITFDTNGDLWGLNYKGMLGIWNLKEKIWEKIILKDPFKILTMDFDKNGMLWIISNNGALLSYSSKQWMNHGFVCLDKLISISFKK